MTLYLVSVTDNAHASQMAWRWLPGGSLPLGIPTKVLMPIISILSFSRPFEIIWHKGRLSSVGKGELAQLRPSPKE